MSRGRRKRVLVVANPFPPMASGGNARIVRFCRHLPEHGWEPVVLTAGRPGPCRCPTGCAWCGRPRRRRRPPTRWRAARTQRCARRARRAGPAAPRPPPAGPARRPASAVAAERRPPDGRYQPPEALQRLALHTGHVRRLDRAGAARRQAPAGASSASTRCFSSYPRGSAHLVAAELARAGGLPWLADYRDPWTTGSERRFASPAHKRAHGALEEHALRRAARVTAVNAAILADLQRAYPLPAGARRGHQQRLRPGRAGRRRGPGRRASGSSTPAASTSAWARSRASCGALAALPDDVRVLFLGVEGTQVRAEAERLGIGHRVRVRAVRGPRLRARLPAGRRRPAAHHAGRGRSR